MLDDYTKANQVMAEMNEAMIPLGKAFQDKDMTVLHQTISAYVITVENCRNRFIKLSPTAIPYFEDYKSIMNCHVKIARLLVKFNKRQDIKTLKRLQQEIEKVNLLQNKLLAALS